MNKANSLIADFGFRIADWERICDGTPACSALRRTKRAKRTQFLDCGLRILDCGFRDACGLPPQARRRPIMQNEPNLPSGTGRGEAPGALNAGANAQNEPNLAPPRLGRAGSAGDGRCKTNPIPGDAGAGCTNKPNLPPAGKSAGGRDRNRRYHRGQICKTNPICLVGRSPEAEMRKTNPISGGRDTPISVFQRSDQMPIVRNEPNLAPAWAGPGPQ